MIRKARKEYTCCICGHPIKKGDPYICDEGRSPKYNENYHQIGIEYYRIIYCADREACNQRFDEQESLQEVFG